MLKNPPAKARRKAHEVAEIRSRIFELVGTVGPSGMAGLSQQEIVRRIGNVSFAAVEACIRAMRHRDSATPIHIGYYQLVRGRSKTRAVFVQGAEDDADPSVLTNIVVVAAEEAQEPDEQSLMFQALHNAFFSIPPTNRSTAGQEFSPV